jgi:hypothetical protein
LRQNPLVNVSADLMLLIIFIPIWPPCFLIPQG